MHQFGVVSPAHPLVVPEKGITLGCVDIAYVDGSGNTDPAGSLSYALGCVVVTADEWPSTFDDVIDYRRFLRDRFGVPVRAEVKANYLLRNSGAFRKLRLGESARFAIYRGLMRLQPKLGLRTFAIVVRKHKLAAKGITVNARDLAWEYLLQRIERMSTKSRKPVMIVHDEGEGDSIRKMARKARRAGGAGSMFGTGHLSRPAKLLVDDPVVRRSHESYFVQLADLAAYAAFRNIYPPPARTVQIVPRTMWTELGSAAFAPVNQFSGGTPGIVVAP